MKNETDENMSAIFKECTESCRWHNAVNGVLKLGCERSNLSKGEALSISIAKCIVDKLFSKEKDGDLGKVVGPSKLIRHLAS